MQLRVSEINNIQEYLGDNVQLCFKKVIKNICYVLKININLVYSRTFR